MGRIKSGNQATDRRQTPNDRQTDMLDSFIGRDRLESKGVAKIVKEDAIVIRGSILG